MIIYPVPQSAKTILGALAPKKPKPKPDLRGSPATAAAMAVSERFGGG